MRNTGIPHASRRSGSRVTRFSGRGSISANGKGKKVGPASTYRKLIDLHAITARRTRHRKCARVEARQIETPALFERGPVRPGRTKSFHAHNNMIHQIASQGAGARAKSLRTSPRTREHQQTGRLQCGCTEENQRGGRSLFGSGRDDQSRILRRHFQSRRRKFPARRHLDGTAAGRFARRLPMPATEVHSDQDRSGIVANDRGFCPRSIASSGVGVRRFAISLSGNQGRLSRVPASPSRCSTNVYHGSNSPAFSGQCALKPSAGAKSSGAQAVILPTVIRNDEAPTQHPRAEPVERTIRRRYIWTVEIIHKRIGSVLPGMATRLNRLTPPAKRPYRLPRMRNNDGRQKSRSIGLQYAANQFSGQAAQRGLPPARADTGIEHKYAQPALGKQHCRQSPGSPCLRRRWHRGSRSCATLLAWWRRRT